MGVGIIFACTRTCGASSLRLNVEIKKQFLVKGNVFQLQKQYIFDFKKNLKKKKN